MQLAARMPDGATLRDHLAAAAAHGGPPDPRLHLRPPPGTAAVWECFVALNGCRPAGMGPSGIPPSEIDAWQRLHGVRLTPWEVELLMAVDRAVLAAQAEAESRANRRH